MSIRYRQGLALVLGVTVWGWSGASGGLRAQTGVAPAQTSGAAAAAPAPASAKKKAAKTRRGAAGNDQLQRIPIEQVPATAQSPDKTSAQRAADQRLLQRQQAQSAQAAQITDQQVNTAQQRIDKVQSEQRIQDAPGPSQTGIVPAAGPPMQPAANGVATSGGAPIQDAPTIQEAPGPSQTLAPAASQPYAPQQPGTYAPPQTVQPQTVQPSQPPV